ncbi:hypothetical protein VSH64_28635 [Amycolatopsis rhabdoformis]|uniref:Uncharacterized protein n=1 Tax=Amycolatopsis rhabdoformis TaxID=1448059 RepID=A0ABZ1HYY8_9PSEU|nr:hypothetical protein [Amycolatopsis rhabdoformis]WSE26841.1 hypothetical protein VSH64_28635 [Amycolatopsis rhabdoformis]
MRDFSAGLHPAADLMTEENLAHQEEVRRRAALSVASNSLDADDCAQLLEMLGLHTATTRRGEVA